jgi:hypothetical protein
MSLTKATIKNLETNETLTCLFNPSEYTIAKQNQWETKNVVGRNSPNLEFTGGGARSMTMDLMFDVFEQSGGDVRTHIDKLWQMTNIESRTRSARSRRGRPPFVLFQWGGDWHFRAALTSLSVKYTLFRQDGTPVRAVATVTLQEAEDEPRRTNPTSGSLPGYRRYVVEPHDTLPNIAFKEYGDATKWRTIAEANGIDDPLALSPGQALGIPPLF